MTIAVVGTGSIGRRHLQNLLFLGNKDLIAVSEHSGKTSIDIDGTIIPALSDYEDALGADVTAVVIGNPTSLHLDYLRRALTAGKHVYLEKPASLSAEGLGDLVAQSKQQGLVVAMGTMYRFNERLEQLRDRVRSGECGTLLSVETQIGEHIADYHPDEDYRQSYTARKDLGGGVLLTQIHLLDWLNWVFGPFNKAFAVGGHRSDLEIDVEDTVSFLLESHARLPAFGHLDYLQRPKQANMRVTGTKGQLEWKLFDHSLSFTPARNDADTSVQRSPYDRNAMFVAAMQDFLSCIRDGSPPRATLEDGRAALCIVDAIRHSMITGNSEKIAT